MSVLKHQKHAFSVSASVLLPSSCNLAPSHINHKHFKANTTYIQIEKKYIGNCRRVARHNQQQPFSVVRLKYTERKPPFSLSPAASEQSANMNIEVKTNTNITHNKQVMLHSCEECPCLLFCCPLLAFHYKA